MKINSDFHIEVSKIGKEFTFLHNEEEVLIIYLIKLKNEKNIEELINVFIKTIYENENENSFKELNENEKKLLKNNILIDSEKEIDFEDDVLNQAFIFLEK
jgi:hypothetical protein